MSRLKQKPGAAERQRASQALERRIQGQPYYVIAEQLGYRDESGARKAVDRLLGRAEREGVEKLRQVEGRRLDELQAAIWGKAVDGNLGAIREVLRISERRSKLLGLDAPVRVDIERVSASEFAEKAAELLAVTGSGPLLELAGRPAVVDAEVVDPAELCPGLDGWADTG